jgi:hypothetical protein
LEVFTLRALAKQLNRLLGIRRLGAGTVMPLLCASPPIAAMLEPIGLNSGSIFSLARHPVDHRVVYGQTESGGVFRWVRD